MKILLFGTTGVGKTTIGKLLSELNGITFLDIDDEIKKRHKTILNFQSLFNSTYKRHIAKTKLTKITIENAPDNCIVAISPIFYQELVDQILLLPNTLAIELIDSVENLYNRMVFSDDNDVIYSDDKYKNEHKRHYIAEIKNDIICSSNEYKNITKFNVNGDSPLISANRLNEFIHNISGNSVQL